MSKKPRRTTVAATRKRNRVAAIEITATNLNPPQVSARKGCLDTAAAAVLGDRALNYGSAEDNFGRIAHLFNAYLDVRKTKVPGEAGDLGAMTVIGQGRGQPLTETDVAIMSIMTKIARLANTPDHADSWADIAGYAACGAEVNDAKY